MSIGDSGRQKRGPETLEGRSGPKGLGGVRPHSDYAQPTGPSKRGEHSVVGQFDCAGIRNGR